MNTASRYLFIAHDEEIIAFIHTGLYDFFFVKNVSALQFLETPTSLLDDTVSGLAPAWEDISLVFGYYEN